MKPRALTLHAWLLALKQFMTKQAGGLLVRIVPTEGPNIRKSSSRALDAADFDRFNIPPPVLAWCHGNLPENAKVLELGSGLGTRELAKHFAVTSVEHDPQFLNAWDSYYIHAPLVDGYYQRDAMERALESEYAAIIIDGPPAFERSNRRSRLGFLKYVKFVRGRPVIVVDDIHRAWDLLNFILIALYCGRRPGLIRSGGKISGVLR